MDIGLALGGGGARGIAHIGVLRILEKEKIRIGAIAGTSIGGLIGAVYLSGWSADEMVEKFSKVEQPKLYGHLRNEEPSLLGLAGGTRVLNELLGDRTFADLKVPFAVTAVDLETGQVLVINKGRLIDAVLATIAVPGILPARRWGDRLLVDGGVGNPVPVDVVRDLRPGMPVAAVVLTQPTQPSINVPVPEIPGAAPVLGYLSKLRFTQAFNVFIKAVDVGGKLLAETRLELDKPDLILRPELGDIGLFDRVNISELVELGEDAVLDSLDEVRRVASLGYRLRKLFR
jgi:NTE family protein